MVNPLKFQTGCIDIKVAYMQSGLIKQTINVQPPEELDEDRGIACSFRKCHMVYQKLAGNGLL